ncbi:hypothetical protein ACAX46_004417 [Providencia rettgeri]
MKTVKGAAVDLSNRLSPFSTFGEPVSAPQTGARTGVYGEPAPTVCKWGQSGVRLNTGSTPELSRCPKTQNGRIHKISG